MKSVFSDDKFANLDWMTQITESIESSLNEILSRFPEQVELDIYTIMNYSSGYDLSFNTENVTMKIAHDMGIKLEESSYDDREALANCFRFEVEPDTIIDLKNNTITGSVRMVKIKKVFEDDELQKTMGRRGIAELRRIHYSNISFNRLNEVLELVGGSCLDAMKGRSAKKKIYALTNKLNEVFKNNEWRIRDTELANKVGVWLASYIKNGDLSAWTNFCKLKVMTHNNMPIYSITEEQ